MSRSRAQRLIGRISKAIGAIAPRPRPGLRVLLYHAIGTHLPGADYGMSVAPRVFADQMRWLREESGYAVVSLNEGAEALTHEAGHDTSVAVTFDDGFVDALTEAAPVLVKLDIPFTVFVTGAFLERPPRPGEYLDRTGIRELAAIPQATIGAHGFTHRPLTRLDDTALDEELRTSRSVLADCLGQAPLSMSYPHGAVDHRVAARAAAAGFRIGATSVVGANDRRVAPLCLRRTEILAGDGDEEFYGKLRGNYDWYRLRQRLFWPVPDAT